MTEFRSRRELREAERQGLVPKPEQVFDLPTGSIRLPEPGEMLTRKRIREMEREGLLDPLTGAVPITAATEVEEPAPQQRAYDEVMAETEEPITSSISTIASPAAPAPVAATDIFHSMAVDPNARRPKIGIVIGVILVLLGAVGAAAYMLGIFK
jgi:hypothetical protein